MDGVLTRNPYVVIERENNSSREHSEDSFSVGIITSNARIGKDLGLRHTWLILWAGIVYVWAV